jgi:AraC-like DNA-binding protein
MVEGIPPCAEIPVERAELVTRDMDLIAAVARRWGWTSPGQFAAAYQRRFGEPPSRTLRT